jgi:hypothetical protein
MKNEQFFDTLPVNQWVLDRAELLTRLLESSRRLFLKLANFLGVDS